jgi:2-polyprenyl-3-methyl-5-hydroxy-6-metoxy-1,4-benzoquinol methylase
VRQLDRRISAALSSDGSASDRIYDVAIHEIEQTGIHGAVLDYGAGRYAMSNRLIRMGAFGDVVAADIVAYDDPPEGVRFVRADLNEPMPFGDESFDLIVAIEIVEHLENARATCREFARLMRPRGRVVMTTPNNESFRAILSLFLRGHFAAFTGPSYPAHITALVETDIRRAMVEAGLSVERFFFTDQGSIPRLPTLTWQGLSGGVLKGRRFSDNVGCVAAKA